MTGVDLKRRSKAAVAAELKRARAQTEAARKELAKVKETLTVVSEAKTAEIETLVEVNANLVIAAAQSHSATDSCEKALDEVTRSATFDPLTGLPNRVLLMDRLEHDLAMARRTVGQLALLFLDLDGFKDINDSYGHGTGDEILKTVAQRLSNTVRETDTVSRHGGDEFLVLLPELQQPDDAGSIARELLNALGQTFTLGEQHFELRASIGIGLFPQDAADAQALIECADQAMYRSKRSGRGAFAYFQQAAEDQETG